jgi:transcriptional regulator with XRE-family HTH domain
LSGYDVPVTDEETLVALGQIALEAREHKGVTRQTAVESMGINYRTLGNFEAGRSGSIPNKTTLRAIEIYYDWRPGSLQQTWDNRRDIPAGTLDVRDLLPADKTGLLKAAHLTDRELMAELNFRFLMRDSRGGE